MTQEHPITPSPELVTQWSIAALGAKDWLGGYDLELIATQAARWGADQELEACCEWLSFYSAASDARDLHSARRPNPPSLKEQALQELDLLKADATTHGLGFDAPAIRRALESLPD